MPTKNPPIAKQMALDLARHGYAVFPCKPRNKKPATKHGFKDGSTDPAAIEKMFRRDNFNIGIATGPMSRVWALDVDGPKGIKDLADLESKHGALPKTVSQKTGGGGKQLFWKLNGEAIRNKTKVNGLAIDVRGVGGYCIVPPSIHPTGNCYEWENAPGSTPLVEAPPWLSDFVTGKKRRNKKPKATTAMIPEGQRDDFLISVAGLLRRHGLSEELMLPVLQAANTTCCSPPLSEKEVAEKAASAARYEPKAKSVKDVQPWPKAVDGGRLLAEIERTLNRYVILPPGASLLIAAWIVAAWVIHAFDRFPHLAFTSPTKRCGKTRALQVVAPLSPRPLFAASVSAPVVYRAVEDRCPTLILDEAQSLEHGDDNSKALRCLYNSGIDRKATVLRMGGENPKT